MKLTTKKLIQIIREEVQNEIESKDKHAGHGYTLPRGLRDRERNVGVGGEYVPPTPTQVTADMKKAISPEIDSFLADVNDEGGVWQQEMGWLGGGMYRDWKQNAPDGKLVPRTKEMNDKIRARIANQRKKAKRIPFTVSHMAQDLQQIGQSAWNFDGDHGGYPSLSLLMHNELVPKISTALDLDKFEAKKVLKAYFKGLKR